jgi:hypothetical protein
MIITILRQSMNYLRTPWCILCCVLAIPPAMN